MKTTGFAFRALLGAAVCALLCLWFFPCVTAFAVDTKTWTQADLTGFDKGTLTGLSISSEGKMTPAPAAKEIFDASTAFLWAVARDSKGNIYTGGGGLGATKAKLFAVDPKGTVKTLAELDGIAIQAIAIDAMSRVYAATSPDGKVYRVSAAGQVEVFYDPKAKYIWAMAFDKAGNLYVATGDRGEIHRVTPAGVGSVFFKTEETHARSLAVDANGNLIVGTDPSGLILRVSLTGQSAGQGFVVYQAPKREITALAVAADGTIYAAGDGNKQAATPAPLRRLRPRPRRWSRRRLRRMRLPRRLGRRDFHRPPIRRLRRSREARRSTAFKPTAMRARCGATRRTWSMPWRSMREGGPSRARAIEGICTASIRTIRSRGCAA